MPCDPASSCPPCHLGVQRLAPLDGLVYLGGPCPACPHHQTLIGIPTDLVRSGDPSPLHEALIACGLPCPDGAIDRALLERLRDGLDREERLYQTGSHRSARN